jgi:monothiol glutaredoxin
MVMSETANADTAHVAIGEMIKTHPVVLFMKGTPTFPQCGFSASVVVVDVLRNYELPLFSVDVLANPAIRQAIKDYSDWPTVPQLYIDGTFVGGCDIVREMHEAGEFAELIARGRNRTMS